MTPDVPVKLIRALVRAADIVPVCLYPVPPAAVLHYRGEVFPGRLAFQPVNICYTPDFPLFYPSVVPFLIGFPYVLG
jgi:hypothetical protein